jgi:hypothetical protein
MLLFYYSWYALFFTKQSLQQLKKHAVLDEIKAWTYLVPKNGLKFHKTEAIIDVYVCTWKTSFACGSIWSISPTDEGLPVGRVRVIGGWGRWGASNPMVPEVNYVDCDLILICLYK